MEKNKAIETLKQAATMSQAIHDMFLDFATRERARSQVTLSSFYNRMSRGGFKHTRTEYADGLKVLSECGFGELRYDRRNNVTGLFNIKTTLSSIGQAVVGKRPDLEKFSQRNKYTPLTSKIEDVKEVKREVIKILSGVDYLVRSILNDTTIPAENRVKAARALLQEVTQ